MKYLRVLPLLAACLIMAACGPIEQSARDASASLAGGIVYGQGKYGPQCKADPTGNVCVVINKAVAGQNALTTAIETYCAWSTTAPPPDVNAKCVPVKSAEPALKAAISNANQLVSELKGVL